MAWKHNLWEFLVSSQFGSKSLPIFDDRMIQN